MPDNRDYLPINTQIVTQNGNVYRICGAPIGCGGGSIIYPVREWVLKDGNLQPDGILRALKECYPISLNYGFTRDKSGQIISETGDGEANRYLLGCRQRFEEEYRASQKIFETAVRMVPLLETSESITLTIPGHDPKIVSNTVTVMDSLQEKGHSIGYWLKEQGRFSLRAGFRIIQQLLFALQEVHAAGYLHLDIQNGNVFLRGTLEERNELVTLIDFGEARSMTNGKTAPIVDKRLFTTQGFTAPEILLKNDGTLQLGPEADIYSVGCLLLYLLTSRRPNDAQLRANRTGKYLQPNHLKRLQCPPHLLEKLQTILAKALAVDPAERYAAAEEMLKDVNEFLDALPALSPGKVMDYNAFICYKHGDLDDAAALHLQQKLEHFRGATRKKKNVFQRVFVDRTEVNSGSDIKEIIDNALMKSQWLIVLCSPETPQSPWVQLEIETFIKYHDRSHILAVLVDGDPETSFPEELKGDANGNGQVLAADARGKNISEIKKKLSGDELLRVAAPMLGVPFDTLKDRRRLYILRRGLIATALGLCLAIAFGVYAMDKAQEIQSRNIEIQEQTRKRSIAQSMYLGNLALKSQQENVNSDQTLALAVEALSGLELGYPVSPQAQQILEDELMLYFHPENYGLITKQIGTLHHMSNLNQHSLFVDSDAKRILSSDFDSVYVWDLEELSLVHKVTADYSIGFSKDMVDQELGYAYYWKLDTVVCMDYRTGDIIWETEKMEQYLIKKIYLLPGQKLVTISEKTADSMVCIQALDVKNGTVVYSTDIHMPEGFYGVYETDPMAVSSNGNVLAFVFQYHDPPESRSGTHRGVICYDISTEKLQIRKFSDVMIPSLTFSPDGNLLLQTLWTNFYEDFFKTGTTKVWDTREVSISLISPEDMEPIWKNEYVYSGVNDYFQMFWYPNEEEQFLFCCANQAILLNWRSGEEQKIWQLSEGILSLTRDDNGLFCATTQDGYYNVFSPEDMGWISDHLFNENVYDMCEENGRFYLTYGDNKTDIQVYESVMDNWNWEKLADTVAEDYDFHELVGSNIIYWDANAQKQVLLIDTETGKIDSFTMQLPGSEDKKQIKRVLGQTGNFLRFVCCVEDGNLVSQIDLSTGEQKILTFPRELRKYNTSGIQFMKMSDEKMFFKIQDVTEDPSGWGGDTIIFCWTVGEDRLEKLAELEGFSNALQCYLSPDESGVLLVDKKNSEMSVQYLNLRSGAINAVAAVPYQIVQDEFSELLAELGFTPADVEVLLEFQNQMLKAPEKRDNNMKYADRNRLDNYRSAAEVGVSWNEEKRLFSVALPDGLYIYQRNGSEISSIPITNCLNEIVLVSFLPGSNHLVCLNKEGMLMLYDWRAGRKLAECQLDTSGHIDMSHGEPRHIGGNQLLIQDGYVYYLISTDEETFGLASTFSADAYDVEKRRIYDSTKSEVGYFHWYSPEALLGLGRQELKNET